MCSISLALIAVDPGFVVEKVDHRAPE